MNHYRLGVPTLNPEAPIMKIVMSKDGIGWKDITPEKGNLGCVPATIAKDPQNPGRILVTLGDLGGFRHSCIIIRWLDDTYLQSEMTEESIERLFFRK